jgi:branched-chain amino acid transport system ATP-binding protein
MHAHEAARHGIARTFQNIALFKGMSVLDNIMTGRNLKMHTNFLQQALYWGATQREEIRHRRKVEEIIDFLQIENIRKTPVGRLPYGLQKRVELGRALAAEPTLLLLDEPMAGMNVEEKQDMCRFILDVNDEFGTTIVLIEHDMGVVMDISDRVIVLDYGKKIGDGSPKEVTTATGLSMTDKERLDIINRIYGEVLEYKNLTWYYTRKNIGVSYLRSKEKGDAARVLSLYGTHEQRYW